MPCYPLQSANSAPGGGAPEYFLFPSDPVHHAAYFSSFPPYPTTPCTPLSAHADVPESPFDAFHHYSYYTNIKEEPATPGNREKGQGIVGGLGLLQVGQRRK